MTLSSTLYKSTTIRSYGKPRKTNPVGGASCPAAMALETADTFSMVYQIGQMAKISPGVLQRLSDTICCIAQMYKVELRARLNNR